MPRERPAIDWTAVVERGTGALSDLETGPRRGRLGNYPIRSFEARHVTWQQAVSVVDAASARPADGDLFRIACLLLAELAVIEMAQRNAWADRLPHGLSRLNQQRRKD